MVNEGAVGLMAGADRETWHRGCGQKWWPSGLNTLKGKRGCLATRVSGLWLCLPVKANGIKSKKLGAEELHQPPKFLLPLLRIINKEIKITVSQMWHQPRGLNYTWPLNNTGVRGTDLSVWLKIDVYNLTASPLYPWVHIPGLNQPWIK